MACARAAELLYLLAGKRHQRHNNLAVSVAAWDLQFLENRWYVIHSHLLQTCALSESCE